MDEETPLARAQEGLGLAVGQTVVKHAARLRAQRVPVRRTEDLVPPTRGVTVKRFRPLRGNSRAVPQLKNEDSASISIRLEKRR